MYMGKKTLQWRRWVGLLLAGSLLAVSSTVLAERVGLVLSGGGARGLAHIGVLKALKEQGIEVQAVAGTSMGAIVGGLYASGHSPEQVERIAREMDWPYAFSDRSPRSHSLYEYRQLDAGLPVDYRIRLSREGIKLPRAIFQGQHLSLVLDELFAPVLSVDNFDELPIPFRAVASDLVSGDAVVMDTGNLSTAIRASMSIPGLFEPVEYENMLLVDGGIASNIPAGALSGMNLDRLIVVDVGTPRRSKEDINTVGNVVGQLTALLVRNNSDQQLSELSSVDIVVTPQLGNVANSDFTSVDDAVEAGYMAAIEAFAAASPPLRSATRADLKNKTQKEALTENLSKTEPDVAVALEAAERAEVGDLELQPRIDFIRIDNDSPVSDKVVLGMIRQKTGEHFDPQSVRTDISYIYALDYFDSIRYELRRENGETGLTIICRKRGTSNTSLQLGLELADDFRGNATFGIAGALRAAGLNAYGGTAVLFANVGSSPVIEARFFQPLDYRLMFFVEPLAGYRADNIDLFVNNDTTQDPIATFQRRELYGGLDFGAAIFRQRGEIRLGWRVVDGVFNQESGVPIADASYNDGYLFSKFGWDTYDDLAFPHSGIRARAERQFHSTSYGADADYDLVNVDFGIATTLGEMSLVAEVSATVSDDGESFEGLIPLGGFLSLSGLPPDSIWGFQRALSRLVATVPLKRNPVIESLPIYLGASYEVGNVWATREEIDAASALQAGSVFIGARTPLGPGYIAVGVAEGKQTSLNLYFGHVFR